MKRCEDKKQLSNNQLNERKKNKKPDKPSIEAIQITAERKKQCNAKALDIVIRFSERTVSEMCLIENLQFISQEHYQDIVEERAINELCGYPLCSSQLKNIPTKQFHISTIHNKVFDITDRKNFCSNMCYKASKYLKDQISTSPLWLRENLPSVNYEIIALNSKGGTVGDEVDLGFIPIKVDDDSLSSTTTTHLNENDSSEIFQGLNDCEIVEVLRDQIYSENCTSSSCSSSKKNESKSLNSEMLSSSQINETELDRIQETEVLFDKVSNSPQSDDIIALNDQLMEKENTSKCQIKCEEIDERTNMLINSIEITNFVTESQEKTEDENKYGTQKEKKERKLKSKNQNSVLKNSCKQGTSMQTVVKKLEQTLREWFSVDSLCFTFGEERLKEMLAEKNITEFNIASRTMDAHVYERYLAICKKLKVLELEDTKMDTTYREESKKPLPDYEVLKEEAKELDLKVRMFYKGDRLVQFDESHKGASSGECENRNSEREPVLPLVDLHAQKALRRRIVIDKVKRVLQDLQKSLRLRGFNLIEEVQTLVSTFDLSAHNVTMRPAEWNLMTIFIIKLLSVKDKILEQALNSNPTNKYLTLLLMSYSLDSGYLDRLIVWLTDIESVLQKKS